MSLGLAYIPVELFSILGICLKVVDNLLAKINHQLLWFGINWIRNQAGKQWTLNLRNRASWVFTCQYFSRIMRGHRNNSHNDQYPPKWPKLRLLLEKHGSFCYSDYILQIVEMGRGISEVESLKALLIYKNGSS